MFASVEKSPLGSKRIVKRHPAVNGGDINLKSDAYYLLQRCLPCFKNLAVGQVIRSFTSMTIAIYLAEAASDGPPSVIPKFGVDQFRGSKEA